MAGAQASSSGAGWDFETRMLLWITIGFAVLNVGLRFVAVSPEALITADSLTFQRMAEQFLSAGAFAEEQRLYRTRFLGHKFVSCGGPE